jgi:hypothetical protein
MIIVLSIGSKVRGLKPGRERLIYFLFIYFFYLGLFPHYWGFSSTNQVSWSHTTHTVGLLWTSDQPVAEASSYTGQNNIETQETNIHALSGIRTRDPSNQAAADLRLVFILGLFNDAHSRSNYVASHDRLINEQWVGKDVEGRSLCLI